MGAGESSAHPVAAPSVRTSEVRTSRVPSPCHRHVGQCAGCVRTRGADRGGDDARDRQPLQDGQVLLQHHDGGEGRGGRLEAHQDPEHRRAQAPERDELAAVGDDRAQQPDQRADQQHPAVPQARARGQQRRQRHRRGRDDARHGQAVEPGPPPPGAGAEQDVRRPRGAGEQGVRHAEHVETGPLEAEQGHADAGQHDPGQVAGVPRPQHGQRERADELDGDRDARAGCGRRTGRSPSSSSPGSPRSRARPASRAGSGR